MFLSHLDVTFPLFLPLFLSLKRNKYIFKKKEDQEGWGSDRGRQEATRSLEGTEGARRPAPVCTQTGMGSLLFTPAQMRVMVGVFQEK